MDVRIRNDEQLQITSSTNGDNFVRVQGFGYNSLVIDLYAPFQYIEVRRKESNVRVFTFHKKSDKKECDFGWYEDAEVILAINDVNK